jgi:hypothetical protein
MMTSGHSDKFLALNFVWDGNGKRTLELISRQRFLRTSRHHFIKLKNWATTGAGELDTCS